MRVFTQIQPAEDCTCMINDCIYCIVAETDSFKDRNTMDVSTTSSDLPGMYYVIVNAG